ncbi:hypothetical protein KM043_007078 [Ampulex compressa]|nr:hypothetical protein KM043_007078 [Ampulex compressa]
MPDMVEDRGDVGEFNVRPDSPRITPRRFIKTVKQKKRLRPSVMAFHVPSAEVRSESNGANGPKRKEGKSVPDGTDHGAFSWSSSSVHPGLVLVF